MALNWSFKARLHNASDAMKKRYVAVCDELRSFAGVKTSESWDRVRVYVGKKTYATMFFRGKTLCLTLALAPQDFIETKYICEDVSDVSRFAATPLLTRMSSDRQVKYLAELLGILFENVEKSEVVATKVNIPYHTTEELVAMKLIKVYGGKNVVAEEEEIETPRVVEEQPTATTATVAKKEEVEAPREEIKIAKEKIEIPQPEKKPAIDPLPKVAAAVSRPQKPAPVKVKVSASDISESAATTPKGAVNLGAIDAHFEAGSVITLAALKEMGLLGKRVNNLKVLGGGELTKPLTIAANRFSASALNKIEIAGGTATIIPIRK